MGRFLKKLHHVCWPVQEVPGDERPGRCYEIYVGAKGPGEGNYFLSVKCTAALPVVCGTNLIGSTAGLPPDPSFAFAFSGAQIHRFCPNTTESAEVSTVGSTFVPWILISGQGEIEFKDAVAFDFEAGECYDIIVGGDRQEGNYSLQARVDPTSLQKSPWQVKYQYLTVSVLIVRVTPMQRALGSTSGLESCTWVRYWQKVRDFTKCGGETGSFVDSNADCISFNARPGRCYEIYVGAKGPREGNYLLSVKCTAALPVVCGTNLIGSTVGLPPDPLFASAFSGAQIHRFCPNTTESAEVNTFGSTFVPWILISGQGEDSPSFADIVFKDIVNFDFEAGKCYDIIVGGVSGVEGNYSLSIDCGTRSKPIEASTCGSNFPTEVSMASEVPILDRECADCPGDPNAACIGFNVRPQGPDLGPILANSEGFHQVDQVCYEILVGGRKLAEGNYSLSIDCTTCPTYLLNLSLLQEIEDLAIPLTVWGSADEAESALAASLLPNRSQVILRGGVSLSQEGRDRLNASIRDGLHLIVYEDLRLIRQLTGLSLLESTCPSTAQQRLDGGGFGRGPATLPRSSDAACVRREELPQSSDGFYGSSAASAWTSPFGRGRITHMASKYDTLRLEWRQLLESSLGMVCAGEVNTTTRLPAPIAATPVVCGSIVNQIMPQGNSLAAGTAKHTFCTPNATALGQVLFSTCGSEMDTSISVNGPKNLRWQCTNCGACGQNAELKVSDLANSTCYDVTVYSRGNDAGNYSLWVSCCEQDLCNFNGFASHIAWGPPRTASGPFDLCRCQCSGGLSGAACDQCSDFSLSVPRGGRCESCFPGRFSDSQDFYLMALEQSSVTWTPPTFSYTECNDLITLGFRDPFSLTERVEVENVSGKLTISMASCPFQNTAQLSGYFLANEVRFIGRVVCAPRITCNSIPGSLVGTLDFPPAKVGSNVVSMHILTLQDEEPALAALALLEFLASAASSSRTAMLHGRNESSLRFGLGPSAVSEAQEFFNSLLEARKFQEPCVSPDQLEHLPPIEAETELVVLVGQLCGTSQAISSALIPILLRGRLILVLGYASDLPGFMSIIDPRISEVADSLCAYLSSWLLARNQVDCVDAAELQFAPQQTSTLRRNVLAFPGLCSIASCCVGHQCSDFLTFTGATVSCHIPLLELGFYNVSVVFPNGSRLFARDQLRVVLPPAWQLPSVRRFAPSPERFSGVFQNLTREVDILASGFDCCDIVAIGFQLNVMGRLVPKVCNLNSFVPPETTVTLPEISDEEPFPGPVKFFAARCFMEEPEVLVDGSSCAIPQVPANAPSLATDMTGTWNLRKRIDEYVEEAIHAATSIAPKKALTVVRQALRAAGLKSSLRGAEKVCTQEDIPNVNGVCTWSWSEFAKDAGVYLISAGFEEVQTNWTLPNAKKGDIVVFPAFNMQYELNMVYEYVCEEGFIAVLANSDVNSSFAWVSETFYSLEVFQRARQITSLDAPRLYRLRENTGLWPEHSETLRPVAIKHDVLLSMQARDDVLAAYVRFVNRTEPDEFKPCPSSWQRPFFPESAGNMPVQLLPVGFKVLSPPEAPICFQELPRPAGDGAERYYSIVRCCYDNTSNISDIFIDAWPSRITFHDRRIPWTVVEEMDVEELKHKAAALAGIPISSTDDTPVFDNNPYEFPSPWRRPRPPGTGVGDPQCLSYDGFRFECNFLGEAVWTRCQDLTVHVFAELADSSARATVIKGVAVREKTETAIAIANTDGNGSPFDFTMDGDDLKFEGLFITVTLEGTDTLIMATESGHEVKAVFHPTAVALEIRLADSCFNRTDGLLGNNNGNSSDDLQPFNENEVLPLTSPAEVIYEEFVLSWCKDNVQDSLFPPDLFRPCDRAFIPLFVADLDIDACPAICNGDGLCCLDSSEGGEELAITALADAQAALQAQGLAQSYAVPLPPILRLPTKIELTPDFLQFNVSAEGSGLEDLTCSICATPQVQCQLTIMADNARLKIDGAIPAGRVTCTARAGDDTTGVADIVILAAWTDKYDTVFAKMTLQCVTGAALRMTWLTFSWQAP
eukprot:s250_g28.t1